MKKVTNLQLSEVEMKLITYVCVISSDISYFTCVCSKKRYCKYKIFTADSSVFF